MRERVGEPGSTAALVVDLDVHDAIGLLDVSRSARAPAVGERVTVIPNHICPCVNLRDAVWLRGGGAGAGQLSEMPVDARGMLV